MRQLSILILVAAQLLLSTQPGVAGTVEENKQIVLAMIDAVNARDLDALDTLVAADVRRYSGATPGLLISSRDQLKEFLRSDFATIPDSLQTVNLILGEGDKVAVHVTYAGTQQGSFGPFPASGRKVEIPFVAILRIEDNLIAELWVEWDNLNMLSQLGHYPPRGTLAPPTDPAGN